MYISSKPSFSLNALFTRQGVGFANIFPFNQDRCIYFYTARYALAAGIKALEIGSGEKVLMPSYNCWVEIDPIKYQGVEIRYYEVNRDLRIDLDALEEAIDGSTKAVLVTHYLGFPQPIDQIKEICAKHNVFLIEDCAHAFLSEYHGKPLGSFGDISIFSFRKTLPIPDGGALVINNRDIEFDFQVRGPNPFSTLYVFAERLKYRTTDNSSLIEGVAQALCETMYGLFYLARGVVRLLYKTGIGGGLSLVYPSVNVFRREIQTWGMSAFSRRIMKSTDFGKVKRIRRENFKLLLEYFSNKNGISLLFEELSDGVCPLFFPILVNERDRLYEALKKRGISGHDWWGDFHPDVPWKNYPEAKYLKTHVFGFPIHQDLTSYHIQKMLKEFEKAYAHELSS